MPPNDPLRPLAPGFAARLRQIFFSKYEEFDLTHPAMARNIMFDQSTKFWAITRGAA